MIYDAGMSITAVGFHPDRLLALGHRYNMLVEELERTAMGEETPAEKQARIAVLFAGFLADDPRQTAPWFANLVLPLADRLFDEGGAEDTVRALMAPKSRLLITPCRSPSSAPTSRLPETSLSAPAGHVQTKTWLGAKLAKHGIKIVTAAAIMEWRDEVIARMGEAASG